MQIYASMFYNNFVIKRFQLCNKKSLRHDSRVMAQAFINSLF